MTYLDRGEAVTADELNQLDGQESQANLRSQRELETLLEVAQAIGTAPTMLELVTEITRLVTNVYDADRTSMYVHEPESKELLAWVHEGLEMDEFRIPDYQGIAGDVFHQQADTIIPDTLKDSRFDLSVARAFGYVPRSMMVLPIKHAGSVTMGVLQVMHSEPNYFTREDLRLLDAIAIQIAISLTNVKLREQQNKMFESFVKTLVTAIDSRDPTTGKHSFNVANYAVSIAEKLGLHPADLRWLWVAGLLHDVGKIGIPEGVLTKPGRLTDNEYDVMKRHAAYSREILSQIDFTPEYEAIEIIAPMHHERMDGQGYPEGLKGNQIPMKARILCVADVFDALTSNRHYRKAMSIAQAVGIMDKMTPDHLDPLCVAGLKAYLGEYSASSQSM